MPDESRRPCIGDDGGTGVDAPAFHGLPELAGAELGVPELLDERRFDLTLALLGAELAEGVLENAEDAEALDALGTPIGGDLRGMTPPQLLGVASKNME